MKLLLILFFVCCVASCSDDDGGNFDVVLNGSWTLTNVSCFCAFSDGTDFTATQITFIELTNELIVTVEEDGTPFFRPEDVYSYSGSNNTINLDDGNSFNFEIDDDILILDFIDNPDIADDEISYTFLKNDAVD